MTKALLEVSTEAKKRKVDMRTAAYIIAITRVRDAMQARGWLSLKVC